MRSEEHGEVRKQGSKYRFLQGTLTVSGTLMTKRTNIQLHMYTHLCVTVLHACILLALSLRGVRSVQVYNQGRVKLTCLYFCLNKGL